MPVTTAAQLKYEQSENGKATRVKYYIHAKTSPNGRYKAHRTSAKHRGIDFNLTFDEWWNIWADHWWNRGRYGANYCMARYDDTGGYELGNVYICTMAENLSKARTSKEGLCQNAA